MLRAPWAQRFASTRGRAARSSRLLVPKSELDACADAVIQSLKNVKYGDPFDPENIMGPQNSALQRERVEGHIQHAIDQGG